MPDILAVANAWQSWPANVRFASGLAAALDGTLTGLYLAPPPEPLPEVSSPTLFAELVEIAREQVEGAHRADPSFCKWAAEQGVHRSAWYVSKSPIDDALNRAADWYDLVVLARGSNAAWGSVDSLGRTLLTVGLPCVLVPEHIDGAARLDTIAVAWKGTPESLRALHAALPLLRRAKRIVLIRDNGPATAAPSDWNPATHVESYIAWHGLDVSAVPRVDDDEGPGAILAAAMRESADLLVMGAYGRSRLNEWVFGGATRYALEHARIPLFMRH